MTTDSGGPTQDLRLAIRALRATPVVSTVAVLSLALGIGANSAIFSLVDKLLLRTLPIPNPERLALVSTSPAVGFRVPFSYATFQQIRRHGGPFDGVLAYSSGKSSVTIGGSKLTMDGLYVSENFFTTLDVPAVIGRTFASADDVPGGGPTGVEAVVSYRFWQEHFGGSASVLGGSLAVDRTPVTIVGVTTPDFFGLEVGRTFDFALPVRAQSVVSPSNAFDDDVPWLGVMLRLKPGLSLAAATAALRAVQPQIRAASMPRTSPPPDFLKDPFALEPAGAGTSALRERFERPLVMLFAVVVLVLLIACANVGNLLLARGAARRHELSVRVALGASRWHLARPVLVESLVLAASGAGLGLVFATWTTRLLVAQLSTATSPVVLNLSLDWRVLAFTGTTMSATALVFGIAPALRAARVAPMAAMRAHGAASTRGMTVDRADAAGGRVSLGGMLLVAQVALSLLLVVAAGLFVRTFERLTHASLGFDPERILVVAVTTTVPASDRNEFYHRLIRAAAVVPGVAHAGGSLNPPLVGFLGGDLVVSPPGTPPPPDAERISRLNEITPGWLAAYGTPIGEGRDFDARDTRATPPVMLVNQAFARRFFPGRTPIGSTLAITGRLPGIGDVPLGAKTVVGLVNDAVWRSIREPARPTMYFPLAQRDGPLLYTFFYIAVRPLAGSPTRLIRGVATALTAVNPDLTLTFRPVAEQVNEALTQDRLVAMLSGFFGGLALLLAGLGLYGVTAYTVAGRRAEIAIRMALGAAPASVVRLVLTRVSILIGIGVFVGAAVSLWASTFVTSLLYGVAPRDPVTFVGAAGVLVAVGLLAGWLPAWRASRIDPAEVLRES